MPQIAVDSKGNKIRWDESKKDWIPVEKAVDAKGNTLEFDGSNWAPVPPPKKVPAMIMPGAEPKKDMYAGSVWSHGGKMYGPPTEDLKSLKDIGQAVGSVATGMVAYPASLAIQGAMRSRGIDPKTAEDIGKFGAGKISVHPTTPGARAGAGALATPFAPFGMALDAIKDPDLKMLAGVALLAYPYAKLGIKGFIKGRITSGKGITPKELDVIIKTTELPPDVAASVESTRLQSPPKPTGNPAADAKAQADFLSAQKAKAEAAPANSPGISVTPPAGPTTGVKVGDIPGVKTTDIQPINKTPQQILIEALKQAPVLHPEQKAMYSQEYGERFGKAEEQIQAIGGEAGLAAGKAQMKGKMATVDFESIADQMAPYRNALKKQITDNNFLTTGERFQTERGLDKLFAGQFPAPKETELLNRVYGGELTAALMNKQSTGKMIRYWAGQVANIPRSIMASFDLSAPLRQGIWLVGRPREFFGSFGDMFKAAGSESGYRAIVDNIAQRPTFGLMKRSKLALTEMSSALNKTEEQFLGADILERGGAWAQKKLGVVGKGLNLVPRGVRASQRAYTGFLNKLRADTFDSLVKDASELGLYNTKAGQTNLFMNPKLSNDIAHYVNAATGRGHLGDMAEHGSTTLNAVFFSPRLMSSRLTLLNPATYFGKGTSKFVRQAAIGDAIKFGTIYTTISALAKLTGEATGNKDTLGADLRSADFGKIKIGNTRIDMGGGFGQYIRELGLILPAAAGQVAGFDWYSISSTSGKKTKIGGGYNETSIYDLVLRFLESKENPIMSFVTTLLKGKTFDGKNINLPKELVNRITPIVTQDIVDMAKDDPNILKIIPIAIASIFGAGVQTYGPKESKTFLNQTGKPVTGDPIIDEVKRLKVNPTLGQKTIKGEPIPPEDIDTILKEGGAEMRRRIKLFMDLPAWKTMTDEQKKKKLDYAVRGARALAKQKYKQGIK